MMSALPSSSSSPNHQEPALVGVPRTATDAALSILAVTPHSDASNVGTTHLLELGRGLTHLNDRYRTVTMPAASAKSAPPASDHARLRLAAAAMAILRTLADEPTDIVQCTSVRATYAAALAIFATGMRHPGRREPALITTLPTLRGSIRDTIFRRAARHLRLLSDGVIVPSESARAALLAHGIPRNRVAVVPPIRDLRACLRIAEHAAPPTAIPGIPPRARVVLTISHPGPHSGLAYLIEAWPMVARAVPDAYLVIATGDDATNSSGVFADDARAMPSTLSSSGADHIIVAGSGIPMLSLLARADVVALSTVRVSAPTTLLRSLAARRPVVATSTGGISDIIAHEHTGLLVPPCDCPALAVAIQSLLGNRALAHRLAEAGQRHVRQHYTRPTLVAATRAFYLQALDQRATRTDALMPYDL